MNIRKLLSAFLFIAGFSFQAGAQVSCPPNIDFEYGNLSVWKYYIGTCCAGGVPTIGAAPVAAVACRHTLTSAAGLVGCTGGATDPVAGFPIVPPGAGSYAFKLGNSGTGAQAERAIYYVHVPASMDNYSLVYRYAVVLQDPSHTVDQQPRFTVKAFDSTTLTPVPCADYTYVASTSLLGFVTVGGAGGSIVYLPWATGSIDLSGMAGTTVAVEFTTADCSQGGHYGYAYIDLSCGLFQVSANRCDTLVQPTLIAPPGFEYYTWYDSATFTTVYGTNDTLTMPFPPGPTTVAVVLTPFTGFGCPDTLYTRIIPAHMALHPTNDTSVCEGTNVTISPNATDVATPLTYSWSPGTGLSCTACASPVATPMTTTAYTVTVTNTANCVQSHVFNITVFPTVNVTVAIDTPTCHDYTNGAATVTAIGGTAPLSYVWTTSPPQYGITASGLPGGTYTVIVTDAHGCADTTSASLINPAARTISIVATTNPTTCGGTDGSIVISSSNMRIDSNYVISYKFNGVPQTQIHAPSVAGQITLNGLSAGSYTNITVIYSLCPYNVVGPITLVDPPTPDLSGVSSNSFVCEGDTLKLFATTGTTGVSWSWEGPAGFVSSAEDPMRIPATLAHTGVYSVTVSKANCFNYSSTYVEVRVKPIPVANSNTPICSGDTLYLRSSSSNGATSYLWEGPNLFSSVDKDPYIAHVQTVSTGAYTVGVTLNGCTVPVIINGVVNQTPAPPLGPDTNYCQYDIALPFSAAGSNLLWYNNEIGGTGTTVVPTPSTAKGGTETWYVTQTSAEGCTSDRKKLSARVWNMPYPDLSLTDRVSCLGKYMTFTVGKVGEGSDGITWHFEPNDSIVNVNPVYHAFNMAGTYLVTANAYYRYCRDTALNTVVDIFPYASFDLGPDTSICKGSNAIQITAKRLTSFGGGVSWLWNTGETTPSIQVVSPGIYYAKATLHGCETSDSIIVAEDCYIDVPNIFTPNGDGVNDYFFPRQLLSRGLTHFSISIYNRWGQQIFTGNALDGRGWDGKFNGVPQPEGVFIYVIDAEFKDGQKENHKGNVTLMR